MNKKTFLGLLVVVVTLVVATAGCTSITNPLSGSASPSASAVPQNIPGYATYTNSTAGIRLQYPSGWNVTEGGKSLAVVEFTSTDNVTSVAVLKYPVGTSSLEETQNAIVNGLLNQTTYKYTLVSTEKTTLAGMPAINSTLNASASGVTVTQRYSTTVKDNQAYSLLFTVYPENWNKYQNDFGNMSNSFAITS
jgi:hypothetical protein